MTFAVSAAFADSYTTITPFYIQLPHHKAVLAAVRSLLRDGASFQVKPSGRHRGSITIHEVRGQDIVEQVRRFYRLPWYVRWWREACNWIPQVRIKSA